MTQSSSSTDISIFHRKSTTFVLSRDINVNCILIDISNSFDFLESLKVVLINMVAILMMSAKFTALGLPRINPL